MKLNSLIMLLAFSSIATSAYAEDNLNLLSINDSNEDNMAVTCRIGGYSSDKATKGNGIEFAFRYKPTAFVATEVGVGYFNGGVGGGFLASDGDIDVIPVTATVKGVLPLVLGNLYAGGGVGEYFKFPRAFTASHSVGGHVGVGLELNMRKSEIWIFDYKKMIDTSKTDTDDISGNMFTLGFGYKF